MRGSDLGRILVRDGRFGGVEARRRPPSTPTGGTSGSRSCGGPRSSFEERGVSHRSARDDELDAVREIVRRADEPVTIREADLSRIP
jgi:hypothetical protein